MNVQQRVVFTALPQGLDGSRLRLLAFVSPRLYVVGGPTVPHLSLFPDFVDWPSTKISWKVIFGSNAPVSATVASPAPDSAAWKAVFSSTSYVQPYEYESFSGRVVNSYPHAYVRQFAYNLYGQIASKSPLSFPARGALFGGPSDPPGVLNPIAFGRTGSVQGGDLGADSVEEALGTLQEFMNTNLAARTQDLVEIANSAGGGYTPQQMAMLQVQSFVQPRTPGPADGQFSSLAPVPPPAPPGTVTPPDQLQPNILDFHQVIAGMSDHAGLLRALGLVVELTVPVPSGPLPATVQLVPSWTPRLAAADSFNVTPATMLEPTGWPAARSANTLVTGGEVEFDKASDFTLVEVDTEGASVKLLDLARTLWRLEINGIATHATSAASSIPALRQGGIAVAQLDRAWALANTSSGQLPYADEMNAGAEADPVVNPTVGVEDLTKGVRVDIYDKTLNRWFPLCARSAPDAYGTPGAAKGYVLGKGSSEVTVPVPSGDEGFVTTVSAGDSTPDGSTDLYLQETLFRWNGWSLIGSRPGKTLGESPDLPVQDQAGNPAAPNSDFPVEIDYVPTPGTLPLLRFGRTYRARARVADLGGGGPSFDKAATTESFQHATAEVTYGRFEPVPSPVLLMRQPVTEGERLERLIIRSNYDIPDDKPGTTKPKITPSARHVVPPAMAQLLAELHGMFDHAGGLDGGVYNLIKAHANAVIGGVAANRPTSDPNLPSQHGPGQTSGLYYDTDDLSVPYLPDVLARSAAFQGVPGAKAGAVTRVPFSTKGQVWPDSQAFQLRIVGEGSAKPVLPTAKNGNVLTVSLPKAAVVEIQCASGIEQSDLDVLGLWEWFKQQGIATADLEASALDGLVWMLTPPRSVLLVHAVRQPLTAPSFSSSFAVQPRALGDTTATLADPSLSVDRPSSVKIDIGASWDEWVDNGENANPDKPLPTAAPVGEVDLSTEGDNRQAVTLAQEFHDTLAREVSYSVVATTRFAEYFTERTTLILRDAPVTIYAQGIMPGSAVVTGTYKKLAHTFLAGEDYSTDDAKGTISRLPAGKISNGESVLVAFVPLPVTRSSLEGKATGDLGVSKSIPSTARPVAPDVLYAVPAWSNTGPTVDGKEVRSERLGGAIRVYLARPWWSSGGGEQLGVVLLDPTGSSVLPYYTQWGSDPLWNAAALTSTGVPIADDFPLAVTKISSGITLAEATGTYGVAGHDVQFDPVRDLWFCDIQLATGEAYFPFVRLALARYQPNSITGAHISGVVLADCSQTLPTRSTVVDLSASDSVSVTVTGYWYTETSGAPNPGPSSEEGFIYAQIERQTAGLTDELSWQAISPSDMVALAATTDSATGLTTWTGSIKRPTATGTYRVVIWEQQSWPTLAGSTEPRIVFFDAISI
ncbi:MAG: hypothetical protein ACLPYW_03615 [Acidimicrobiales bacterium]